VVQANEAAECGSEFTRTLRRGDPSLFGAAPSAPYRPEQRRQKITKVSTVPQLRILIGNWWGEKLFFSLFLSVSGAVR